jgi:hypothetical protein
LLDVSLNKKQSFGLTSAGFLEGGAVLGGFLMKGRFVAAVVGSLALASSAHAAVVFSAGSIEPLANVHSDHTEGPATTVFGDLVTTDDVTFTSPSSLTTNGHGVAQFSGPWASITYGMTDHTGIVVTDFSVDVKGKCKDCVVSLDALLLGGGHATDTLAYAGDDGKYYAQVASGPLIDTLTISVMRVTGAPVSVDSLRQVKIGLQTPSVPEPATWAMMILGLGALGVALRRRSRLALA